MSVAAIPDVVYRVDQLWDRMPDEIRWELVEGELRMMAPPGDEHGRIALDIMIEVGGFVKRNQLGVTHAAETGFLLQNDPDIMIAPDGAFTANERVKPRSKKYVIGPPDMALEVRSPSDSRPRMTEKMHLWLDHGTREVWIVDPDDRTFTVHGRADKPLVLTDVETLDGGDLLPGFAYRIADAFSV